MFTSLKPSLLLALLSPLAAAQQATLSAPPSGPAPRPYLLRSEPTLTHRQKLALLRRNIKYVFVLFQENRSFDFYFGSYPGADGLYSLPPAQTPGFTQQIVNTDGTVSTITPFRIPPFLGTVPLYPSDLASVNHSHTGLVAKVNLDSQQIARNDHYALTEEGVTLSPDGTPSKSPTLARKQMAELVMGHLDCDTAPFLWRYADRFTLFDRFFATELGPSTPNAIALISGQVGETQWLLHPDSPNATGKRPTIPMTADPGPKWEPRRDAADKSKQTNDPKTARNAPNLTFATLPLSFMGQQIEQTTAQDNDPVADLADLHEDIHKIAGTPNPAVPWGWYQQGYDHEPTDPDSTRASHKTYIAHHNAPAYFGYIANNPAVEAHLHGLGDFFADVTNHRLPTHGVFYIRGGYGNLHGYKPLDPNPKLATVFYGDDDHPGYSDSQLSEALLAEEINAITHSPYWKHAAILIAYDESDGLFDHAQPHIRSHDQNDLALSQGPRVPFLVLSPFGEAHTISHEPTEHSSVIKFVNELFSLTPLADLPDEQRARALGLSTRHEADLGPADDGVPRRRRSPQRLLERSPPGPPASAPRCLCRHPAHRSFPLSPLRLPGLQRPPHHPNGRQLTQPHPARLQPAPGHQPRHPRQRFLGSIAPEATITGRTTRPVLHCFHHAHPGRLSADHTLPLV